MRAIIIGAGPAGLAVAACLKQQGVDCCLLERGTHVGEAWHHHYDRLRLHTPKGRSALPGLAMPKAWARYPTRHQLIKYLRDYAEHFDLDIRFGVDVQHVSQAPDGWSVQSSTGLEHADIVVVATGLNGTARVPDIPGRDLFEGPMVHSSAYRNAQALPGARVMVVGFGNSGGDIALDLAEAGRTVSVVVRGPVNLLPRELLGIPIVSFEVLTRVLPYRLADRLTAPVLRLATGRPERYGMVRAETGPAAQVIEEGRIPHIDVGALAAIQAGRITVLPGIERLEAGHARLVDGRRVQIDAVVLATGYSVDLRGLLGSRTDVLDDTGRPRISGGRTAARGLYFCSYRASPNGQLRQIGREADAIAADVAQLAQDRVG